MKIAATIASILLGLVFLMATVPFFLGAMPEPKLPPGPILDFMNVFGPTGYMRFVKVFELLGAILVIIPKTRNLGLLVLGPIIVNILAFNVLVAKFGTLSDPMAATMIVLIIVLPLFLLWTERQRWLGLVR
jgi:putative oxidoreductase